MMSEKGIVASEEELKRSVERLEALIDEIPIAVMNVDIKGKITYVNKTILQRTGYLRDELVGKNGFRLGLVPHETLKVLGKRMKEKLMGKPPSPLEIQLKRKDGTWMWAEIRGRALWEHGVPVGVQIVGEDITERKRAEEALRKSEEKYKSLVNNVRLGIFRSTTGPTGRFLEVNPAMEEITGYSREELLQMNVSDLYVYPEKREAVLEEIAPAMGKTTKELRFRKKDRTEIVVSDTKVAVRDSGGKILYFDGILEDITERRRIEQELIEKTVEVERANQLKSEFLAHMSHELRTPLNVIIGFSELMVDKVPGEINEEQRKCLDDILGSSKLLLGLINEVLDLSKVESGKAKFHLTNLALNEVIQSLARTMLPVLAPRQHSLDVEIEEGLPLVHADKAKVRQVLINLLNNATKFTPGGGKLKIEAVREDNWCQVSVIDNGIGIKEEDQEQIFEPFCQLDNPLTKERGGSGLGLAVVKQIIEKHGGQIWVESEYGRGSRFTFTLPLAIAD